VDPDAVDPAVPQDSEVRPESEVRQESPAGRRRIIRWSAPIERLGLPLALLVDLVGVLYFAATQRLPVLVAAGTVTTLVGAF
jgi:hypothetical protein